MAITLFYSVIFGCFDIYISEFPEEIPSSPPSRHAPTPLNAAKEVLQPQSGYG